MTAIEFTRTENLQKIFKTENPYIQDIMIEFAKYHVQEALKAAYQNAMIVIREVPELDKDSILKCYPLENIK